MDFSRWNKNSQRIFFGASYWTSKLAFCFDRGTGHAPSIRKGAAIKKDVTHLTLGDVYDSSPYASDSISLDYSPHTLRAVRYLIGGGEYTGYDTPVHWTIIDQYGTEHHFRLRGVQTYDSSQDPDSWYNLFELVDDYGNRYGSSILPKKLLTTILDAGYMHKRNKYRYSCGASTLLCAGYELEAYPIKENTQTIKESLKSLEKDPVALDQTANAYEEDIHKLSLGALVIAMACLESESSGRRPTQARHG